MRDKLKLHCNVISGYAFSSSDWKNDGIPVIKIGNISNGEGITENKSLECVDEAFLDKLDSKYHISNGDILISLTGSHVNLPNSMVGRCCRNITDKIYLLNQRAGKILSFDNTDHNYLYYLLSTKAIKYEIVNRAYGGANQVNVSPKDILDIMWEFPDLEAQRKISGVLLKYDELIENNLARISLLEKMASELYKEWFVRFRFPGHEAAKFVDGVPEGWEMRKLKELIEFDPLIRMKKGVEYRTIPMDLLSTDSMLIDTSGCEKTTSTSGAHFQNGDTLLARITPCLENGKTGFVNTLDDGETAVGSTEFIVMRSKLLSPHLVYFIARSEYFRKTAINSMNGADGRQRAKISKLQSLSYPLPTRDIIDEFSEIVEPFFEEIKNLNIQNHNLTKQRDLLLPRLMSGKLSVEPLLGQTA